MWHLFSPSTVQEPLLNDMSSSSAPTSRRGRSDNIGGSRFHQPFHNWKQHSFCVRDWIAHSNEFDGVCEIDWSACSKRSPLYSRKNPAEIRDLDEWKSRGIKSFYLLLVKIRDNREDSLLVVSKYWKIDAGKWILKHFQTFRQLDYIYIYIYILHYISWRKTKQIN